MSTNISPDLKPAALIAGPTASGKSALALDLAERLKNEGRKGVIVNADSAQVYADLQVLSARPSADEMAQAEHRLYGAWDGSQACSAAQWAEAAKREIADIHAHGDVPILVGGTGERRTLRTLAMYGDIFNFNGWTDGMSMESYRHKIGVLERHCEEVGRDPAQIKSTIHMPLNLTDDKESAKRFIERLGPGTMAGPRDYIIDRIGEFADAGVEEIMFPPFRDAETVQRVDEEIVAAFD